VEHRVANLRQEENARSAEKADPLQDK